MNKKLLLADDSITIQKVIGITFAHEDYELTVVDNGDAALEKARASRPDLILADVFMPGKNGYELCAAIKQDPALSNVPVLLLTGTFEPFDEDKAAAAGADSWIAKPFESQALIDRVAELLARPAAPAVPASSGAAAAPVPPPSPPAAAKAAPPEPPAAAPVAQPTPAVEIDADLWDELSDAAGAGADLEHLGDTDQEWGEVPEPELEEEAEDFWGEVSFEEEDLSAGGAPVAATTAPAADEEDLWGLDEDGNEELETPAEDLVSFGDDEPVEAPFLGAEEALAVTAGEREEIPVDDILPLEDVEILEAEELAEEDEFGALGAEDFDTPAEEDELLSDSEAGFDALPEVEAEMPAVDFEESLEVDMDADGEPAFVGDAEFEADLTEETFALAEEDLDQADFEAGAAAEEMWDLPEEDTAAGSTEPVPAAPATPAAVSPGAGAESRVSALSEDEVAAIVEKVAGQIVERLAGTILEKIAWEVVPDLAESMIRDELRKVREEAV